MVGLINSAIRLSDPLGSGVLSMIPDFPLPDLLFRLGRILVILLLAAVALRLVQRGIPHLREIIARRQDSREDEQRVRTPVPGDPLTPSPWWCPCWRAC
jgi:hypothetical protein